MAGRLIVDIDAEGRASVVALDRDNRYLKSSPATILQFPLADSELEDLRWYLEDYLNVPYGAYRDRGRAVAAVLPMWGRKLFSCLFGRGPAVAAYRSARGTRSHVPDEIIVRSPSRDWLSLPWELLHDPADQVPLAACGTSFTRGTEIGTPIRRQQVAGPRLRVLMIIARPRESEDVPYTMVARPIVEALGRAASAVEFEILRPPTVEMLDRVLGEARDMGEPFHIVHFDGHGDAGGKGALIFENRSGASEFDVRPDRVGADVFAAIIQKHGVAAVVLNACQSAAMGRRAEAAVASAIVRDAGANVVAMAYTVFAASAAMFMSAFYESLVTGTDLATATRAGRERLRVLPDRQSVTGSPLPLQDWLIPVHYAATALRFPDLASVSAPTGAPVPRPNFIGRDEQFYQCEKFATVPKLLVLHGQAGIGKTALARELGRWRQASGGFDGADAVTFLALDGRYPTVELLLATLGRALSGARPRPLGRDELTETLHREARMVIIDGFDAVRADESPALRASWELLETLARGRSMVLVTTRDSGYAADPDVVSLPIDGLTGPDVAAYAADLLAAYPAARGRMSDSVFADLLDWLGGNPAAMRATLPYLDRHCPQALLDALRAVPEAPADLDPDFAALSETLGVRLSCALEAVGAEDRELLAILSVFHGVVDRAELESLAARLNSLPDHPRTPACFRPVPPRRWREVLGRATALGLLTPHGDRGAEAARTRYSLHPALPAMLASQWHRGDPAVFPHVQKISVHMLALVHAEAAARIADGPPESLTGSVRYRLAAFRRSLDHCLSHAEWTEAHRISRCVNQFYDRNGATAESDRWNARALAGIGEDRLPGRDDPALRSLWLYLVSASTNRLVAEGNTAAATAEYDRLERELRAVGDFGEWQLIFDFQRGYIALQAGAFDTATRRYEAVIAAGGAGANQRIVAEAWHNLGNVALGQGALGSADRCYREAESVFARLKLVPEMTLVAYQRADVLTKLGRFDEADDLYIAVLDGFESYANVSMIAAVSHQRAMLCFERGDFEDAIQKLQESLQTKEEIDGSRSSIALSYSGIGVCHLRLGHFDEADTWLRQALDIHRSCGDEARASECYQHLGASAFLRDQHEAARMWWTEQRAIDEKGADPGRLSDLYLHLHLVAGDIEAVELLIRALAIRVTLPRESATAREQWEMALEMLARRTRSWSVRAFDDFWFSVIGDHPPPQIRTTVIQKRSTEQE